MGQTLSQRDSVDVGRSRNRALPNNALEETGLGRGNEALQLGDVNQNGTVGAIQEDRSGADGWNEGQNNIDITRNTPKFNESGDSSTDSNVAGKPGPNCSGNSNVSAAKEKMFGNRIYSSSARKNSRKSNKGNGADCNGSRASSSGSMTDTPLPSIWCLIKSRTRQHHSAKEVKKSIWFEARYGSVFKIGRDPGCDLHLDDDRCDILNARIVPSATDGNGNWNLSLHPDSRMYRLIGMMGKPALPQLLSKGSIIKVGSISLEVMGYCTDEAHSFAEQFAMELKKGMSKKSGSTDIAVDDNGSEQIDQDLYKEAKEESGSGGESILDSGSNDENLGYRSKFAASSSRSKGEETQCTSENNDDTEDADEAICYICWGGIEHDVEEHEEVNDGDGSNVSELEKKEGSDTEIAGSAITDKAAEKLNPMIKNPCGQCSGCSKYVHLQCLLTWIKKSGSGHCTICNGVLPPHFASSPPNMELKIVRHRRGHSWVGTRRFRLSFADSSTRFIGNSSRADVRLPDRSVNELHAVIKYDRSKKQFFIADNHSKGGTFLQINEPMKLLQMPVSCGTNPLCEFKIGRTNLSVKFSQKRPSSVLNMIGWGRSK
mmetsp:Transcript_9408/g.11280  ORF Transcript_9408/g.11280 Transcript_9408/m.11280 type:complete len:601 (+) Transcript_9408:197-1999(+)|eukprot:CAMPEP_0184039328 /NCGR_PEP_ID=MMETSP0955-20130417/52136_1 /TAXON_ID=627963 /ORGANISM="Aplanochytrium sp, Strain PBS07" /LENGTH=600 /DNA_ID=CAMNT_0026328455 /DNA_START=478 /DNA_END=2280 /DNA_ORIENTATION=+